MLLGSILHAIEVGLRVLFAPMRKMHELAKVVTFESFNI